MIWTQKPPYGTPIDPFGPFASGLYGVYTINECAGQALYNLAPSTSVNVGAFQSGTAAPTWTRGVRGPGIICASASSQYASCGNFPALNSATRMSMFVLGGATTRTHVTAARASMSSGGGSIVIGLSTSSHSGFWEVDSSTSTLAYGTASISASLAGNFSAGLTFDGSQTGFARIAGYLNGSAVAYRDDNRHGAIEPSRGFGGLGDRI